MRSQARKKGYSGKRGPFAKGSDLKIRGKPNKEPPGDRRVLGGGGGREKKHREGSTTPREKKEIDKGGDDKASGRGDWTFSLGGP